MNAINRRILIKRMLCKVFILFILTSCEGFLGVELTNTLVTRDLVFSTDVTATSAMTGVYVDMLDVQSFASGSNQSISALTGLTSDELKTYSLDPSFAQFNQNAILSTNSSVSTLWQTMYRAIYESNAVIEGLSPTATLTENVRLQLDGEARFVRAFCHFYLVNLFGSVPLVLSTDYGKNATVTRASVDEVYAQIIEDLKQAKLNLTDEYIDIERVRPNRAAVAALMSRVYLYLENWQEADAIASSIISDSRFNLIQDLNSVFKKESWETIWQLRPVDMGINTWEGYYFVLNTSPVNSISGNVLGTDLTESFEVGDQRFVSWVGSYTDEDLNAWYFPFKYKTQIGRESFDEYSVVFRLAEQYLIRAEARLRLGDISGSIADVDSIRARARLPLLSLVNPDISTEDLLSQIQKERRVELFTEWGHRWFDLKRLGTLGDVLQGKKNEWNTEDKLYPIPDSERKKNPNLGLQNPGYL